MKLLTVLLFHLSASAQPVELKEEITAYLQNIIYKEACRIELKEQLLPISCYKSESTDLEGLKPHCLNAVNIAKQLEVLQISKLEKAMLPPSCLKQLEKKMGDLKYRAARAGY